MVGKYKSITLCGSTRFKDEFMKARKDLTLQGDVVINARRLHVRKDGQPVSTKQVWWAVKNFPDTLTYAEGRIFLMI